MKHGRTHRQKAKDFATLTLRSLVLLYDDRWGLSSLASERYDYVAREVRGHCLDIGCGPANEFVTRYLEGNGAGVDLPLEADPREARLPFEDETFETATLIANLNRMPGVARDAQLSEAYRCLKPGGNIVVTMGAPMAEMLANRVEKVHQTVAPTDVETLEDAPGDEEYLTNSEIVERLSRAGFDSFFKRYFVTQWGLNHLIVGWKPLEPKAAEPPPVMERVNGIAIIPAFNEEDNVGRGVREMMVTAPYIDLVVVDDGSTDATADEAARAGASVISHGRNLGIGAAMRTGMRYALENGYEYAVQFDADGQHDPAQIPRLLAPLLEGRSDLVIGSRFLGTEGYKPPWPRRLGTRLLGIVVRAVTGKDATDTTSGFRAMDRRALEFLAVNYPRDFPETESLVLMHEAGLDWMEVPVSMRSRANGRSSIGALESVYYMAKVLTCIALDAAGLKRPRFLESQ
jgi:SAM-dependent methyltransferase